MIMSEDEEASVVAPLEVGMKFRDFDSFKEALDLYSEVNNYVYTTNRSWTIQRTNNLRSMHCRKVPLLNEKFKYHKIWYACKHHGMVRSRGSNIRPNQRTYKSGCPSYLKVKIDKNLEHLVIEAFDKTHNHDADPELVQYYPERRRLSAKEETVTEQPEDSSIKPRTSRKYIRAALRKITTAKDKTNLRVGSDEKATESLASADVDTWTDYHLPTQSSESDSMYQPEYLDEDHSFVEEAEDVWESGEVDEEVEVESKEVEVTDEVARVNEAWKLVYMMLEAENRKLKAHNEKLAEEVKTLKERLADRTSSLQKTLRHASNPPSCAISPLQPSPSGNCVGRTIKVLTKQGDFIVLQGRNSQVIPSKRLVQEKASVRVVSVPMDVAEMCDEVTQSDRKEKRVEYADVLSDRLQAQTEEAVAGLQAIQCGLAYAD